jgi:hypothetical protein
MRIPGRRLGLRSAAVQGSGAGWTSLFRQSVTFVGVGFSIYGMGDGPIKA